MSYWGAFPWHLRRDAAAIGRHAARCSAILSSFFPMHQLGQRAADRQGVPHAALCFEPFPFFHDDEVIDLYPQPKRALLRLLARTYGGIDRQGVTGADRLLTLNAMTARQIERVYGRADAIPALAGVDLEFFHPYEGTELEDLRTRLGDGPFVIHSTDFSPIKRTDLALRAFQVAAREVPSATLLVTSTRDERKDVERMLADARSLGIEGRVHYLGFVPFGDVPRLYSLADVLLQTGTSHTSGATTMSLPVKEALACGTAVVRSGATDEDVEDGVSGYLVDPRDSEETGLSLARLLSDRDLARRMGEAGRRRIVETYNWERVVDVFEEALAS
jgi:glycosyltransferase involved in cell wall biosynthesis